mgnify:FL=1
MDDAQKFRCQLMSLHRRLRRQHPQERPLNDLLVLGAIDRLGASAAPKAIAADLHMQRTNVATYLGRLERDGLVSRHIDPDDHRRSRIQLTDAGQKVLMQDRGLRDSWLVHTAAAILTEEEIAVLTQSGTLMEKLATASDDHDTCQVQS